MSALTQSNAPLDAGRIKVGWSQSWSGSFRHKKKSEPRYFVIKVCKLSTTPTEISRNLLLKFTMQNSDMATARNVQVASTVLHYYSTRTFREEAWDDNQTENNALSMFLSFLAALVRDSGSRFTLTWLRDHSHWTHKTPSDHSNESTN